MVGLISLIEIAYWPDAKSGKIRSLSRDFVLKDASIIRGKPRMVKLNNKAKV